MTTAASDPETTSSTSTEGRRFSRRKLLLGAAGALLGGTAVYATMIEPFWLRVVERDLPIEGLPKDLAGRKLLHISDLHSGKRVDPGYLTRSLERAAALEPDLVVVTGDLTDGGGEEHQEFIAEGLARVARKAPLGMFAVLGNHDYARKWLEVGEADRLSDMLRARGITVLRNEAATTGGLQIAGLDDYWAPRFDPESMHRALAPSRPTLVLCHNPDPCDLPIWKGYRGWILSGHTHGGQVKPPFLPSPFLAVRNKRFTKGEFDVGEGRRVYISAGVGFTVRARFNVRPEIALLRMVPA